MLSSAISLPTEGAWIEMMHGIMASRMNTNRFPCGERELKFRRVLVCRIRTKIAPHTGSVNWNPQCMKNQRVDYTIAPPAGNVNWNCSEAAHKYHRSDRSPCEEHELKFSINTLKQAALLVAPHTGSENWKSVLVDTDRMDTVALHAGSVNWNISLRKKNLSGLYRSPYGERELKLLQWVQETQHRLLPTQGVRIEI